MIKALTIRDLDRVRRSQLIQKGIGERTLADTGLPGQAQGLNSTRSCKVEATGKLLELRGTSNQPPRFGSGHPQLRGGTTCMVQVSLDHQAVTAPVQRLDIARPPEVIAERPAQLLDARRERVVAHCDAAPDALEQLLLANQFLRPFGQNVEHRGHARCELHLAPFAPQLPAAWSEAK